MKTLIALFLFVITFNVTAQTDNSLLWKISGNGLKKTSYLFGTIHMIPKNDYFFTKTMEDALNTCDKLVVEVDMFSLSLSEQVALAKKVILPEHKTLKDYMDSVEYVVFYQYVVDTLGVKEKTFEKKYIKIKPFFLSALLIQQSVGKTKTYEQELYKIAKKRKIEIAGLETLEFQMSLADSITIEEQVDGLSEDVREISQFYDLVELYKKQDLNGMYKIGISEFEAKDYAMANLILYNRNRDWIPKIENLINQNSCFIAVGALHLAGEQGVIELLRKKGYTVTAVVSSGK